MNNLWSLLCITVAVAVFAIGFTIYEFVTKEKYRIVKCLFIACIAVFFIVTDFPYMQDLFEQKTTTEIAEFSHFQSSNTAPGTRKLFFKTEGNDLVLIVPTIARIVGNMEEGRIYEIEYFNNSKVVKEIQLIE